MSATSGKSPAVTSRRPRTANRSPSDAREGAVFSRSVLTPIDEPATSGCALSTARAGAPRLPPRGPMSAARARMSAFARGSSGWLAWLSASDGLRPGGPIRPACSREGARRDAGALSRAFELMGKYADHPMDLADASLVAAAETLRTTSVFTLDRSGDGGADHFVTCRFCVTHPKGSTLARPGAGALRASGPPTSPRAPARRRSSDPCRPGSG